MEMYSAHVEVELRDVDNDLLDVLIDRLQPYHASLGMSQRGWLGAQVSVPAEDVAQAATTAAAVVSQATGSQVVSVEVMSEAEFDARQGFVEIPELVGATEAAQILGVSRQRVQQLASEGKLPSTPVGKSLVIPRSAVEAMASRRSVG